MAALYRQHVLKEAEPEPVIQIKGLGGSKKKDVVQEVLHKAQNRPSGSGLKEAEVINGEGHMVFPVFVFDESCAIRL